MITLEEVFKHGEQWFHTVASGGSAAQQAAFFLDPNSKIYVISNGIAINFEEHQKLHSQWKNELHKFGEFHLTVLNTDPERVRVIGTVDWHAEYINLPSPNLIKSVVGEDWIIESLPTGELKFVLYMNSFHHLLSDSAPLVL